MAVNVVKYGNQTVMDISDSTTTSNNLLSGEVGYSANGNRVVGALTVPDELNDLGDVNITQVVNGQVLKYNSTTQKWENSNESGGSGGLTLLAYGKSTWNDFITAYTANKIVYCRASSNSDPSSGSQTRMAFMAYVNNETTPTQVEFQYYRSVSSHSDSQQGDQVYIYLLKNTGDWSVTVRNAFTKIKAGTNMTSSYSSGTLTLNATGGGGGSTVSVDTYLSSGTNIADITVDGDIYSLYAPETSVYPYQDSGVNIADIEINGDTYSLYAPNGGGSEVDVYTYQSTGINIADIEVDGTRYELYAPNGGGSSVSVTQKTSTGTNIADITVDGTTTHLYAPSGSDVSITPTYNSGTKIADYSINGTNGSMYIPESFQPDIVDEIDKQILSYDDRNSKWKNTEAGIIKNSKEFYVKKISDGFAEDTALVGCSIGWNQLIKNGDASDGTNGWTCSGNSPTLAVTTGSSETNSFKVSVSYGKGGLRSDNTNYVSIPANHKVIIFFRSSSSYVHSVNIGGYAETSAIELSSKSRNFGAMWTYAEDVNSYLEISTSQKNEWYGTIQVMDMTRMFGIEVADYIYNCGNKGIMFFKSLFPKNFYEYNSGISLSVNISKRKIIGNNLLDRTQIVSGSKWTSSKLNNYNPSNDNYLARSPLIRVVPNHTYYFKNIMSAPLFGAGVYWYASNGDEISLSIPPVPNSSSSSGTAAPVNWEVTAPANAYYVGFNFGINQDFSEVAMLVKDNPYTEVYDCIEYTFDETVELNGILRVKNEEIISDGDVYTPDGKVQPLPLKIDLGSLSWSYSNTGTNAPYFSAKLSVNGSYPFGNYEYIGGFCERYPFGGIWKRSLNVYDTKNKMLYGREISVDKTYDYIVIRDDDFNDATTFKTSLSGVYLYYMSAWNRDGTVNAQPYEKIQYSNSGCIDEFIDYQESQNNRPISVPVFHKHSSYSSGIITSLLSMITTSRMFTINTTDWVANTDSSTNVMYPYIATITTGGYSNTSCPSWKVQKENTPVPTSSSIKQELGYIEEVIFNNTGITLYATATPSFNVTLIVN